MGIGGQVIFPHHCTKKLIKRRDSKCKLSLRRQRPCTTKYNRLVHKLCYKSTRLCVGTHIY